MSAVHPKADIGKGASDVRFVPKADILIVAVMALHTLKKYRLCGLSRMALLSYSCAHA
jgi:hypothetical protein